MARDPRRVHVHTVRHDRGCRSYVIVDPKSREACVVDPLLEHMRETLEALQAQRASLRWIVETHAHGDHVSGAALLHDRTGAEVVGHPTLAADAVTLQAEDGRLLALGEQRLVVRHAPGVTGDAIVIEAPGALFTGDTLLIGTVGVRDAPGSDGDRWFDTMRSLFDTRDEHIVLHPGHDDMGREMTTVKAERSGNRWLREDDREAFLELWRSDARAPCAEASRILQANREGARKMPSDLSAVGGYLSPVEIGEAELRAKRRPLEAGAESRPSGQASGPAWLILCAVLAIAGTVAGWMVHPGAHGLSLLAALLLLGRAMPALESKRRHRRNVLRGTLQYQGAPPEVVM